MLAVSGTLGGSRAAAPSARRARPAPASAGGPVRARAVRARRRPDGGAARARRRRNGGAARVRTAHGDRDDPGLDRATLGDRVPPRGTSAARARLARSVPGGQPQRARNGPPGPAVVGGDQTIGLVGTGLRDEPAGPAAMTRVDESADPSRTGRGCRAANPAGYSATSRGETSPEGASPGATKPGRTNPGAMGPEAMKPGVVGRGGASRSEGEGWNGATGRSGGEGWNDWTRRRGNGMGAWNGVLRVRGSRASPRC